MSEIEQRMQLLANAPSVEAPITLIRHAVVARPIEECHRHLPAA